MLIVYTITIFVSAALLFLVQPMIAKVVLPLLGGSPSVWVTAMVFFQALLLGGYAYAHGLCRFVGPRRAAGIHIVVMLLPVLALPIAAPHWDIPTGSMPEVWLLGMLLLAVGAPFFVLSTTGPILQRWFSQTDHRHAKDPYFLYAASNAGSLLALLAYPLVMEPLAQLSQQRVGWSAGYVVFVVLMVGCAVTLIRRAKALGPHDQTDPPEHTPVKTRERLLWVLLAFVPSSMMLGVTSAITTDIAAAPLLWIVPLSLYLLTFVIAFSRRRLIPMESLAKLLPIIAAAMLVAVLRHARTPIAPILGLHLAFFLFAALICHTRLADRRPAPDRLTEFFLFVSIGGVLGGVFNALVAPVVFNTVAEYPIVIALACLLRPAADPGVFSVARRGRILDAALPIGLLVFMIAAEVFFRIGPPATSGGDSVVLNTLELVLLVAIPALAVYLLSSKPIRFAGAVGVCLVMAHVTSELSGERLHIQRTFFGVYHVTRDPLPAGSPLGQSLVTFSHGTTQHGQQSSLRPETPLGYYHPDGPIGHVFADVGGESRMDEVALVGLGAGALAAYGREGQRIAVYEIDDAVVQIARNPEWFTYLSDSRAELEFLVGDGRIRLSEANDNEYGMIVLDAFSSDAIPVHLLTREAFEVYLGKLKTDGLIAVHITNRHLSLEPVVAAAARDLGLIGIEWFDVPPDPDRTLVETGRATSHWIVLARAPEALMGVYTGSAQGAWEELGSSPEFPAWTDDFSNIFGVMQWD